MLSSVLWCRFRLGVLFGCLAANAWSQEQCRFRLEVLSGCLAANAWFTNEAGCRKSHRFRLGVVRGSLAANAPFAEYQEMLSKSHSLSSSRCGGLRNAKQKQWFSMLQMQNIKKCYAKPWFLQRLAVGGWRLPARGFRSEGILIKRDCLFCVEGLGFSHYSSSSTRGERPALPC